ncbi:MAG: CoA transferase [Myxococcota bacterium]|jgi:formyl-CoA transferase/CoA:oxalate CoA-transferase|nr:CoA transferase [Myxococcota bacterium]
MLSGVRVLDLTRMLSGPYAGMLLQDLGADVVKVEPPGGDPMRELPPEAYPGMGAYFLSINRGKRSLVIDLERPEGRALVHRLAERADVVLYNYRPDVPPRLGVDPGTLHRINPRLIVCSLTGFGETGPWADRPSYDLVIQALSGAMSLTGEPGRPPVRMGIPLGDLAGGSNCVTAIAAALFRRERTGEGCYVCVSLLDSLVGMLTYVAQMYVANGNIPPPAGSGHQSVFPYMIVDTADQPLVLAIFVEKFWVALCRAIDRPEWITDPRFARNVARLENRDRLEPMLREVFRTRTAGEWMLRMEVEEVPAAPVQDLAQVMSTPQIHHQGMIQSIPDGLGGSLETLGCPIRTPDLERRPTGPCPRLDQHGDQVVAEWLELDAEEVRAVRSGGGGS